ncbi:MAG: hypothetical protein ACE5J3_11260 [Methanosarcinales archaeon]
MKFENNTPTTKIKVKGPLGEKELVVTIDSGAFKTLIPLNICSEIGLKVKEIRKVRGVCKIPVDVKIFWADVFFDHRKVIDTIIGFDLPVDENAKEYEKSLMGRDILVNFDIMIGFKKKAIVFEDC